MSEEKGKAEPDWRAAYQRAVQDATLALSGKAAAEAKAYRLRLTDEEQEAVREALEAYCENDDDPECKRIARVLGGLLERHKENPSE